MAQLSPLIQFTAGTPAVAADVNSNFAAIRNHINSTSIDTENIAPTLTSRSGGPILFLNQSSQNEIVFSVQNSQPNTGVYILQSTALADATKAVIKIEDSVTQLAASNNGKAELWLSLAGGSTIPALLVEHGANTSMSLTKTQLNLFSNAIQATSTGILNATTVNLTGSLTATAPVSDAIAIKVKGRSSDNTAIVQFKSNDDATVYASVNSSTSGLGLNLPDTADSYVFQVNSITKGVIDNNGIDGQYLKTGSVTTTKILDANVTEPKVAAFPYVLFNSNYGPVYITGGTYYTFASGSITITTARNLLMMVKPRASGYQFYSTAAPSTNNGWRIVITGPSGTYYSGFDANGLNLSLPGSTANTPTLEQFVRLADAGTYTIAIQGSAFGDNLSITNYQFLFQVMS